MKQLCVLIFRMFPASLILKLYVLERKMRIVTYYKLTVHHKNQKLKNLDRYCVPTDLDRAQGDLQQGFDGAFSF